MRGFQWNKVRYRADRPLRELIDILQKDLQNTDNDVKAKLNQYNAAKGNLVALQRRQTYCASDFPRRFPSCTHANTAFSVATCQRNPSPPLSIRPSL